MRFSPLCKIVLAPCSALLLLQARGEAATKTTLEVPMTAAHWKSAEKANVQYVEKEGFPNGIILLKEGEVALQGLRFRDGTIEFDIKPLAEDIPGIRFRQGDAQNAEEFYIRSFADCRAENDCIQYSPVINGFMLWNVYPQYQRKAPVDPRGWNHVRLVIAGKRMIVFLNDAGKPALKVGELLGNTREGGLELRGPAAFANLTVTKGKTGGLSRIPAADPIGNAPGIVHAWQLASLTPLHFGSVPRYVDMPQNTTAWKAVHSERFGIVNLNRHFVASKEAPALTWVRSFVEADRDQIKRVSLGWIGNAWLFVNGTLIASGKNFYDPESERRHPDGRLSLDNGSFDVPLHRGRNEITIALYSSVHDDARARTGYGWGLAMRYNNIQGLTLPH